MDSTELKPFQRRSRCPKCLSDMLDLRWRRWVHADGCRVDMPRVGVDVPDGEHLDVECRDCRFQWGMQTAEAAGMDPDRQ